MKLFRTSNIETVKVSQFYFGISLPNVVLRDRTEKFEQKFSIYSVSQKIPPEIF